jgi:hypothetical protein
MQTAFTGADFVVMLGAFPRKDGMERKDLLEKNCGIFKEQVLSYLSPFHLVCSFDTIRKFERQRTKSRPHTPFSF